MEKIPLSNVCLGGCTITLKAKINISWNFLFIAGWSIRKFFKKMMISAFEVNRPASLNGFIFLDFSQTRRSYVILQPDALVANKS